MTEELKLQIIAGAFDYAKNNGLSNNDVAKKSGINESFISLMSRNILYSGKADNKSPIADKWFVKLGEWAGSIPKKQYWEMQPTAQFVEMMHWLHDAKDNQKVNTIINESGFGKTYTVNKFEKAHPQHLYKIVVSKEHRVRDIVLELMRKMTVSIAPTSGTGQRIGAIAEKLRNLRRAGATPMIILDEAENLDMRTLQMIKALYDGVHEFAGIVLIGTSQLTRMLIRMKERDRSGMPQLYRRLKVGVRYISSVADFTPFYEKYKIPKNLQKYLDKQCENYGELHDYLEPVIRAAMEDKKAITEDLFRIVHNLPKAA